MDALVNIIYKFLFRITAVNNDLAVSSRTGTFNGVPYIVEKNGTQVSVSFRGTTNSVINSWAPILDLPSPKSGDVYFVGESCKPVIISSLSTLEFTSQIPSNTFIIGQVTYFKQ